MIHLTNNTHEFESINLYNIKGSIIGNNNIPFSLNNTTDQQNKIIFPRFPDNFLSMRKENSKLVIRSLIDNVFLCVEDIDEKFKLMSYMTFRIGHMTKGPEIFIIINKNKIFIHQKGNVIFESKKNYIEIGRNDELNLQDYEKFRVNVQDIPSKCISRKHAIIVFEDDNWYLKTHPLQKEPDLIKDKSTWLLLEPNTDYFTGKGIRNDKIGLIIKDSAYLIDLSNQINPIINPDNNVIIKDYIKLNILNKKTNIVEFNLNIDKNCLIDDIKFQIELFNRHFKINNQKLFFNNVELFNYFNISDYILNNENELTLQLVIDKSINYDKWTALIEKNFEQIKNVPKDLFNNRNFLVSIIKYNESCLEYASDEIKDDKSFILFVISIQPKSIIYASTRLQNDIDILKQFIKFYIPNFSS